MFHTVPNRTGVCCIRCIKPRSHPRLSSLCGAAHALCFSVAHCEGRPSHTLFAFLWGLPGGPQGRLRPFRRSRESQCRPLDDALKRGILGPLGAPFSCAPRSASTGAGATAPHLDGAMFRLRYLCPGLQRTRTHNSNIYRAFPDLLLLDRSLVKDLA